MYNNIFSYAPSIIVSLRCRGVRDIIIYQLYRRDRYKVCRWRMKTRVDHTRRGASRAVARHIIFLCIIRVFFIYIFIASHSRGLPSAAGQISYFIRTTRTGARTVADRWTFILLSQRRIDLSIRVSYLYIVYCVCVCVCLFRIINQTHVRRAGRGGGKSNAAGDTSNYRPPRTLRAGVCVCVYRPRRDIINLIRVYITHADRARC